VKTIACALALALAPTLALAALCGGAEAKLATGLLVGSSYLFGAVGNLWASRGRHPGWALYALALGLIAYGLAG